MGNKKGNSSFGVRGKAIRVEKARYLLFKRGLTQKETAKQIGVSEKTIGRWIKELGWKEKETQGLTKFTDSLIAFTLYIKKNYPKQYSSIETLYNEFVNKH